KTYDSVGGDDVAYGVAIDSQDAVLVAGQVVDSGGAALMWLRKYDRQLNTVWTRVLSASAGDDSLFGVAVDSGDNVIVTGRSSPDDPGGNVWTRKYDSAGTILWTRAYDNTAVEGVDSGLG